MIVPGAASVVSSGAFLSFARALTVVFILFLCFGAAAVLFCLRTRAVLSIEQRRFIAIWVTPALLFFTLIFLKFVNSGYLLIITPPLFAMLGNRAAAWYRSSKHWLGPAAVAASFATANILIYVYAPLYCSYREIRRFERDLVRASACVRSVANPKSSIVVGFDSHFLGYRYAAYYLPDFMVLQYPEVKYVSGTRLFVVAGRRTSVVKSADLSGYREVVFFPLPEGPEYGAYLKRMVDSMPPDIVASKSCDYGKTDTAPLFSLRWLFPETLGRQLYTGVYTPTPDVN